MPGLARRRIGRDLNRVWGRARWRLPGTGEIVRHVVRRRAVRGQMLQSCTARSSRLGGGPRTGARPARASLTGTAAPNTSREIESTGLRSGRPGVAGVALGSAERGQHREHGSVPDARSASESLARARRTRRDRAARAGTFPTPSWSGSARPSGRRGRWLDQGRSPTGNPGRRTTRWPRRGCRR
jgi:hypothetical protein